MSRHTSPDEQREFVERWHDSKLSKTEFARTHGIHHKTFSNWVKRHDLAVPVASTPPMFLALSAADTDSDVPMTVSIGEHVLSFDSPPPSSWFATLVLELSPC